MSGMSLRRLEWGLRAHGTEIAAWPPADRIAALALMQRSAQARRMAADALAEEDMQAQDMLAQADLRGQRHDPCGYDPCDRALLGRMQARVRLRVTPAARAAPVMRWGGLAACALAGLYIGFGGLDADQPDLFAPDLFAAVQVIATDAAL